MLLNGLGWSTPQSQGKSGAKPPTIDRHLYRQMLIGMQEAQILARLIPGIVSQVQLLIGVALI